jgi:hypothetical protein
MAAKMKILETRNSMDSDSFQPLMIVKLSLPLEVMKEDLSKEEQYMLIGKSFFDAFEDYKAKNLNG